MSDVAAHAPGPPDLVPRFERAGNRPWRVVCAREKLLERGALPGASGFDQAAHALRVARAKGVPLETLVAAALPCSWMVNSKAISRVFQRWLAPPLRAEFVALATLLEGGPEAWLARGAGERAQVHAHVAALCIDGNGVAALSKALAVLVAETVPLMDDAALWFAGLMAEAPATAETPRAGAALFVPMLDWFSKAVLASEPALIALARAHTLVALDAAQTLDRLLWFESWGYRYSHVYAPSDDRAHARWWWLACGERQAIVPVLGPHPARALERPVDLDDPALDAAWREEARASLDELA